LLCQILSTHHFSCSPVLANPGGVTLQRGNRSRLVLRSEH
jgi:hypothetical protein